MERFETYLEAFDGTRGWAEIRPLFDDAFHPDAVFVTADGEMNKEQWAEMAKGLADRGAVASDFEITGGEGDTIYYKVTITAGDDEPLHLAATGTLEDGRLIRVEPMDPAAYSTMIERSR